MSETSLYVPVLKSKNGEYLALRRLGFSCLRSLTPLIDVIPPAKARKGDSKETPLATQMKHHAKQIGECWRFSDLPIFIDTQLMPNSGQALRLLTDLLKNHHVVPTHGFGRDESYGDAIVDVVKKNPARGACYRIPKGALYDPDLGARLADFIGRCVLKPSDIDIVVDLESIDVEPSNESRMAIIGGINSIPHLKDLRSITLAGGSFPVTLAKTNSGRSLRKRFEWQLWQQLIAGKKLLRRPRYGDYGIQNPTPSAAAFLGLANLRYTSTEDWIVFRGSHRIDQKSATRNLSAEMKRLCKLVVQGNDVRDSDYSWGDEYIHSCAGVETPANDASKWKAVGFNHHMTHVVDQLRTSA